jgi:hypothetical protein
MKKYFDLARHLPYPISYAVRLIMFLNSARQTRKQKIAGQAAMLFQCGNLKISNEGTTYKFNFCTSRKNSGMADRELQSAELLVLAGERPAPSLAELRIKTES